MEGFETHPKKCLCFQITGYVLQSRMAEARQMLAKKALLDPAASSMYKCMSDLMRKMPMFVVSSKVDNFLPFDLVALFVCSR